MGDWVLLCTDVSPGSETCQEKKKKETDSDELTVKQCLKKNVNCVYVVEILYFLVPTLLMKSWNAVFYVYLICIKAFYISHGMVTCYQ